MFIQIEMSFMSFKVYHAVCFLYESSLVVFVRLWSVMELQMHLQSTVQQRSSIFLLRPRVTRKRMMAGRLYARRSDWSYGIRTDQFLNLKDFLRAPLDNSTSAPTNSRNTTLRLTDGLPHRTACFFHDLI